MQTNLKLITYRITVTLHQINISVKFPCSVTTALKIESKEIELHKQFKLLNGNAKIAEDISGQIKITYNLKNKSYAETKAVILVFLKSSSGRIPAGSAAIPIRSDRDHQQSKVAIEKCPDKTANIEYSLKMTKIKEEDYLEQSLHSRSTHNLFESSHTPITNQIRQSDSRSNTRKHVKTEIFSARSNKIGSTPDERNEKQRDRFNQKDRVLERDRSEVGSQHSQSQSRISKLIMREHENQVSSQRQKIIDLQKEKVRAMKQIRALKQQIQTNSLRNSAVSERQDEALIIRHENRINSLEDDIQKQRSKANEYQTELHKRKLRIQEIEKNLKILQKKNEQMEQELKKQTQQKEQLNVKNKEMQLELRELRQKYQDQMLTSENYAKRAEFKQNVYKEQLKSLNDKYTASESEKQKLLFEKSELINEHEQREKKEKDNYRNRQRTITEEKSKLIRKIDSLEKQFSSKQQQRDHFEALIAELQAVNKKNKGVIEVHQSEIEELNRQIDQFKNSLERQTSLRKGLESELEKADVMDEQRKNLRKTIQQKEEQISQLQKLRQNLETTKKSLTQKCDELEPQLKQKTAALKTLQKEYESLAKKFDALKKSEEQKTKQISDITFVKQNEESRAYGLNEELRELQKKFKLRQIESQKQIENLNNRLTELSEQNQQFSQKCFVLGQQVFEYEKINNDLKTAYQLKLTEIDKLESTQAANVENYNSMVIKIEELQTLKTELENSYQAKVTKLSKRVKQLENQSSECQLKLERTSKNQDQSISKLSSQLKSYQLDSKSKDKQIYDLKRLIEESQSQIVSLTSELEQATLESRQKLKQTQNLKQAIDTLKLQNEELEQKLKETEFELETSKNETKILEQSLSLNSKQKEQSSSEVKKCRKQFQKFRSNNQYSLKTFFNIMMQSESPQIINLTHDDPEIVKHMIEVLKKRKAMKQEYDRTVGELNTIIEELHTQIDALNKEISIKDEQIQKLNNSTFDIEKKKQNAQAEALKTIDGLKKQVTKLNQMIVELEKQVEDLQSGGINLSGIIQQKTTQIEELSQQIANHKKVQAQLELKLQSQTASNQQEVQQILGKTNAVMDELKAELEILKINLQTEETKRKLLTLMSEQQNVQIEHFKDQIVGWEKNVKNRNEDIARLQKQIEQLNLTIKKKDEQLIQWEANHNSALHELEFNNSEHKDLLQKILNLQISNKQYQEKTTKLEQKIHDVTADLEHTTRQLEDERKKFESQSKKVSKQMQNQRKSKQNIEAKLKQTEDRLSQKQGIVKEMEKELENARKKINVISTESVGERQKYLKEQQANLKKLEVSLGQRQKQIDDLKAELEQCKAERDFYSLNTTDLQKSLEQSMLENRKSDDEASKRVIALQKQNDALSEELSTSRTQLKTLQSTISELSHTFESYQLQNNTQVQYLHPIAQKLSQLLAQTEQYLNFMSQFEASKNKIIQIGNYKLDTHTHSYGNIGQIVREINVAAQRCKLQIINKSKIPQQDKIAIVEQFKTLQGSIQRIIRF